MRSSECRERKLQTKANNALSINSNVVRKLIMLVYRARGQVCTHSMCFHSGYTSAVHPSTLLLLCSSEQRLHRMTFYLSFLSPRSAPLCVFTFCSLLSMTSQHFVWHFSAVILSLRFAVSVFLSIFVPFSRYRRMLFARHAGDTTYVCSR